MAGSTVTVMDNTNLVGNNAHGGNFTTDFICWTTEKSNVNSGRNNLYYPGDTFDITQDMDFYPVFVGNRKDVRKIEFVADTNGMLSLSGETADTFAFPILSGSAFGRVIVSTADIPVPVPNDTYRFTGWEIVVNGQTRKYSDAEAILSHYADLPVETDLTFIAKFVTVNDSTISVWFSGTNLRDGFDGQESIYPDNGIPGDREWVGNINLSKALPGGSDLPYTVAQIDGYAQDILDIYRVNIPPERIIDGKLDLKYAGHIEIWEVESGNNAAPWVKLYDTSEPEQTINFEDIKTKSGYELRYHVYFESPIVVGVNYYKLSAEEVEPQYPASIQTVPGYHFTGDTIPVTNEMVNYVLNTDTFKGYEFRYGYPKVGESLVVRENARTIRLFYGPQARTVTVTYHDDKGAELQKAYTEDSSYGSSYDVGDQIFDTLNIDDHHYVKESVTGEVSGTVTSNVTVDVVYTLDDKGDNGPDGTADKYQVEVTYQAVNGTVSFNGPKYVTLYDENGNESESGTGYLKADQIPDTQAGEGYEGGSWSPEMPTVSYPIKAATEFVVTYTAQQRTVTVTYHDDKGAELQEAFTRNTTYGSSYDVGDQIFGTLDVEGHHYIKESVTGEASGTVTSNVTVDVVYTLDDEGNGGPDDIPDKYQVRFEYKSEDSAKLVLSGTLVEWQTFPKKGDEYDTTEKLYPSVDVTKKELGGYHFAEWRDENGEAFESDAALQNTGYTTSMTFIAKAAENEGVTINYSSEDPTKGTVTLDAESVAPATGAPKGSEAKPADGYVFTHWTNANGDTVASGEENRHYTPVKNAQSKVFEADTYTAHFAERGDLSYKVEYYFDGKLGETVSQNNVKLGTPIAYTTTAKTYEGGNYVFERTEGPKTVGGVNNENVLKVYYTLDATGTDQPGTPDGIPDQFQITIRYESNANGSVGGTTVEVHTIQDFVRDAETGEIIKTGAVKPASPNADVTVTANSRYTFSHWSIRGNADKSYASTADLMKDTFVEDVTFAANFRYTGGGSNGGGGGGGTGDGSHSAKPETGGPGALTTITPDDVPLAVLPDTAPADLTMIDDGEVPLAALPKTGQGAMRGTLAMMVSGILLAFAAVGKRKREEENS